MKNKIIATLIKRTNANKFDSIRNNARSYSKYFYPLKCMKCNYDKHFEVCHIEDLANQNINKTLFEVNHPTNLIHLCPNCHWEFDHNMIDKDEIKKLNYTYLKNNNFIRYL